MRTFFQGWKRKSGVTLLALACLFMLGWLRSLVVSDEFLLHDYFADYSLEHFKFAGLGTEPQAILCLVTEFAVAQNPAPAVAMINPGGVVYQISSKPVFVIPFAAIVFPLIVVSACLILSRHQVEGLPTTSAE